MTEFFKQIISALLVPFISMASWSGALPKQPEPTTVQVQEQTTTNQNLGAYNISGGGTYKLKSSIGASDSSIYLSSFKEPVSNIPYTMSYLNTTVGYGTIEPLTNGKSEFVSFSGITQNADGSAILTGVIRGLTKTPAGSSCTASTTLAMRHSGQTVFILSDSPCHFSEYAVKRNNESVTGAWTFPEPTAASNAATKNYVDNLALGGTTNVDKLVVTATAGENVSAGNLLYQRISDGEWYKVDTDFSYTVENTLVGIAQGSGTDGVNISGGVLLQGVDTNQSGLTVGATYFASPTAGAIGTATTSLSVGKARTTTNLYVSPNFSIQIFPGPITFNGTTTVQRLKLIDENGIGISSRVDIYTATGTTHTWTKQTGAKKVLIILVGGGAGGQGGTSNWGSNGGGTGGGSAAVQMLDVPAFMLPSTLSVNIGDAGKKGLPVTDLQGAPGGWGTATYVSTTSTSFLQANGGVGTSDSLTVQATTTKTVNWTTLGLPGGLGGAGQTSNPAANAGGGGGGTGGTAGSAGATGTGGAGGVATDSTYFGSGGKGADGSSDNAATGGNYGAGGGGGHGATAGTKGADGAGGVAVIITYF